MNSCLTTGAADQQTVTDWQTLSWRWRCGHCATPSQLALSNRICFSDPMGTQWRTRCHPCIWTLLRASAKRELGTGFSFGGLRVSQRWFQIASSLTPSSCSSIPKTECQRTHGGARSTWQLLQTGRRIEIVATGAGSKKKAGRYLQRMVWNSQAYCHWEHTDERLMTGCCGGRGKIRYRGMAASGMRIWSQETWLK